MRRWFIYNKVTMHVIGKLYTSYKAALRSAQGIFDYAVGTVDFSQGMISRVNPEGIKNVKVLYEEGRHVKETTKVKRELPVDPRQIGLL